MSEAAIRLGVASERVEAPQESDLALIARLRHGDAAAMEQLVHRFGPQLNRLVGRLTAWSADREDILQEVFLAAWQQAGSYRGDGTLAGWLRRLAVNRCLNHHRARDAFARMLARLAGRCSPVCSDASMHLDRCQQVRSALAELRREDRIVLVLYYLEELSGAEVAEALGVRPETLHVRLHRARQRLKAVLSEKDRCDERIDRP